jgi:hypothetical protein
VKAQQSLLRSTGLLEAELLDLQEQVTAHLAAIPASWGVDADGVTGPGAGRAAGAAANTGTFLGERLVRPMPICAIPWLLTSRRSPRAADR